MKKLQESLSKKALLGIIVILLPILIVFCLSYRQNRTYAVKRSLDDLWIIAEAYEGQVYLFLDKLKWRTEDFASDGLIKKQLLRKMRRGKDALQCVSTTNNGGIDALSKHLIKNKLPLCESITTIHVLALDGRVVASTNKNELGVDLSKEDFFLKGKNSTSITENFTSHNGLPEIAISTPIYGRDALQSASPNNNGGKPVGVIVNFVQISRLNELLSGEYVKKEGAISQDKEGTWETLEVYLVNRDKLMITASKFIKDAVLRQTVNTTPVEMGLTLGKEMTGFYKDYRGIEVLGASMVIPSLNWILLAEIDNDEVLVSVRGLLINAVITGAFVVVMIVLLFIAFLKKVVRPLRTIAGAAKEIARGNFDVAIPVAARDEIGRLCESFNSMSQDVRIRTNALVENEDALRRSELQFRTVADFTWDWEFWMDTSRRFLYTSPSCERISGYTPAELKESEPLFFTIAHPDDRDTLQAEMEKAFSRQTQISFDFRIIRKDGDLRWVSMAYQPITGDNGIFRGVRGSLRDITQRRQMEEEICLLLTITQEIIKAEDFTAALSIVLRKVCDITGWALGEAWIPRPDGTCLECSPAWDSRIKGAEEFRTLSEAFTFPPGVGLPGRAWLSKKPVWIQDVTLDTGFPRAPIARKCGLKTGIAIPVLRGGEVVAVMDFFTTKPCKEDVQLVDIIFSVAAQLGMVIYHKQMEDEMQKAHSLNVQMIASIPSLLIYIDENDRIIQWNKVAETIFGIDAVGQPFRACGIQWEDTEIIRQILDCRYTTPPTRFNDVRFKNRIGKSGFLGITVAPVHADTRRRSRLLLIGNDITQRKILEGQLVQAQKLEAIGQLAAGIAHEINTPTQYVGDNTRFLQDAFGGLSKLIGKFTDMRKACKNGNVTDELVRDVECAEQEADVEYLIAEIPKAIQQSLEGVDRVAKIVRAMKEFSHPGTNVKTATDINKAIENTISVSRNEWKYVAEVITVFDVSLPLIPCLPGEFNQVILNLIINAAHAIADVAGNGAKGIITVSTQRNGNWVEVRIQDTGTGIPEAARSKVFDPFFTTKPIGKGTGQGLAIAHDIIVRKHGGTIDFETATGKGTTFVIRIPIG